MYSFQLGMNQRIIQLPCNLETLFKMIGLPFSSLRGSVRQQVAPSFSFSSLSTRFSSPSFAFPPHYTASSAHFQARTANSTFSRCFFTVQRFLHLSPSPIYPPFHSSRSENVLNCEKISLKSCQPLDKSLTICYTVLVTPTNTDIPRSRAHPRRTDEA